MKQIPKEIINNILTIYINYIPIDHNNLEYNKSIPVNNYKFFATHPASAAYGKKRWDSGNLFNNINVVISKLYGTGIKW